MIKKLMIYGGVILAFLGAGSMDSESIIIPALMTILGALILFIGANIEGADNGRTK